MTQCCIKHVGLQASTGRVQGMTTCDPCSPCVQLVAKQVMDEGSENSMPLSLPGVKVPHHFCSEE